MSRNNLLKHLIMALIVAVYICISCNFVSAATYDATGTWNVSAYNCWEINAPITTTTGTATVTQNGNNFTLTFMGRTYPGTVDGNIYTTKVTYTLNNGTATTTINFTLDSSSSASGLYHYYWTHGIPKWDEYQECDLLLTKQEDNDSGWVSIQGNVTYNGTPLCAMVLANGEYMFSCSGDGSYSLTVPLDDNGEITLFAFADSFAPFRVISEPSSLPSNIVMQRASPDNKKPTVTTSVVESNNISGWIEISGFVSSDGTPLCAMVLANGEYMFSCAGYGEYELEVPPDENGQITLFVFVDGFQPYKLTLQP